MDKFDGKGDFGMWKYKMMGQLDIQGFLPVIEEGIMIYTTQEPKKDEPKNKVRSLLGTCLSDQILRKIMHETIALGQWNALERIYQTKSLPNQIYLKKQFSC
ncbi:hypothetical protein EUTSA_v10011059mg [Eutrema salsugineum]|uniref:Uncharacterized protein n=1 Tax=Eutrema salsugineum TaxID=72664 RepID=V4LPX2_EUTSA|nr:hypothetical protein EUTSA_v10011059mg [Eutrema salsugineum]